MSYEDDLSKFDGQNWLVRAVDRERWKDEQWAYIYNFWHGCRSRPMHTLMIRDTTTTATAADAA